jgi:hypothetical protein
MTPHSNKTLRCLVTSSRNCAASVIDDFLRGNTCSELRNTTQSNKTHCSHRPQTAHATPALLRPRDRGLPDTSCRTLRNQLLVGCLPAELVSSTGPEKEMQVMSTVLTQLLPHATTSSSSSDCKQTTNSTVQHQLGAVFQTLSMLLPASPTAAAAAAAAAGPRPWLHGSSCTCACLQLWSCTCRTMPGLSFFCVPQGRPITNNKDDFNPSR